MCGLVSKLLNPDFLNFIESYGILIFQETKTDQYDNLLLPNGYSFKAKHRQKCDRKSGGIIIVYKDSLGKFLQFYDSESDFVQWVKVGNDYLNLENDLILGCIYIPPENSKYSSNEAFVEIEDEMLQIVKNREYIGLIGDFNAKTGKLLDFVETDESIFDVLDTEDIELFDYLYDYENLAKNGIPLERSSECTCKPNSYGHKLLDICKNNNVYIVNGRMGKDRAKGECTCNNVSLVDYFIASSNLFPHIFEFEIKEFSPLFSDIHNQLHITLKRFYNNATVVSEKKVSDVAIGKWDNEKLEEFIEVFSGNENFKSIQENLHTLEIQLSDTSNITVNDINSVVDGIGKLFTDTATRVFGVRQKQCHTENHGSSTHQTPWFTDKCEEKRILFHEARKEYNLNKNESNRVRLNTSSRDYKREMNNAFSTYQNNISNEIRLASKKDSKKFWNILRKCSPNKRSTDIDIPIEDLYEYFREVNWVEEDDNYQNPNNVTMNNEMVVISEKILNGPITEDEIENVIRSLSNDKATGLDLIKNEYIKCTMSLMLPIYTKIFNIIFDSGKVPESWIAGILQPIFKNKGNPKDPNNYRPITLLSCFSKVFTSILNVRLTKFSEEIDLISPVQAGFRKQHSTVDNIFILQALIELYFVKKKKNILYVC